MPLICLQDFVSRKETEQVILLYQTDKKKYHEIMKQLPKGPALMNSVMIEMAIKRENKKERMRIKKKTDQTHQEIAQAEARMQMSKKDQKKMEDGMRRKMKKNMEKQTKKVKKEEGKKKERDETLKRDSINKRKAQPEVNKEDL